MKPADEYIMCTYARSSSGRRMVPRPAKLNCYHTNYFNISKQRTNLAKSSVQPRKKQSHRCKSWQSPSNTVEEGKDKDNGLLSIRALLV